MRVITGIARGRKLKAPKGRETRPTADRVKEALFNILGDKVIDAFFLDLFAGTGSIGIEALSRGAKEAVFVEFNPGSYKVIMENLTVTGFLEAAQVFRQDVQTALSVLGRLEKKFDLIFIDPPYLKGVEGKTLTNICNNKLLNNEGIVVIESSSRDQLPESIGTLGAYRRETYGDTALSFYRNI